MNENKFYDLGVICGRFGHEHLGHVSLFDTCQKFCKRTLILVGSAQESGTLRNPFTVETRIAVIRQTYPHISEDALIIKGINDLKNEFNTNNDWGKYLKSQVELHMGKFADLLVYGNDGFRTSWFAPEDLISTDQLVISRTALNVSATMVRGLLVIDDEETWKRCVHPNIHGMYPNLRAELMNVPVYKEIYNKLDQKNLTLDSFMQVYKIFEEQDKQKKLAELK